MSILHPLLYAMALGELDSTAKAPPEARLPKFMELPESPLQPRRFTRRSLLRAAIAAPVAVLPAALPVDRGHGRIKPPVPVPDVALRLNAGNSTTLPALAGGHATAVQLMFTQCTTTCPIQAAIFQRVQRLVPDMASHRIQLLSLSVDPQADTPRAMTEWLRRFHAGPAWIAAAPPAKDSASIQAFFGRANGEFASHSTQVNIVDRKGQLVWRTIELPTAEEIVNVLQRL